MSRSSQRDRSRPRVPRYAADLGAAPCVKSRSRRWTGNVPPRQARPMATDEGLPFELLPRGPYCHPIVTSTERMVLKMTTFPPTLRIGILVFDGFEPIDVWGFVEPFTISRFLGTNYISGPPYPFEVVLISNELRLDRKDAVPLPVKSTNGPRVAPDLFREDALVQPIDVLMIPGGKGVPLLLGRDVAWQPVKGSEDEMNRLLDWVRLMNGHASLMTSVCTGAAILAASGILDGKPATTNQAAFDVVTPCGPLVLWDNVARWVDAGRHVTSAGVSAGTDMGFYLVKRLAGRAVAEKAALAAEYDWHRNPEEPIHYPQQA